MDFRSKFLLFTIVLPAGFALLLLFSFTKNASTDSDNSFDQPTEEEAYWYMKVHRMISDNYVKEVDSEELFFNALKGMTDALEYSDFYMPKETSRFNEEISGEFVGIGLVCHRPQGGSGATLVYRTRHGSPAASMLDIGDEILEVEGVKASGLTLKEVYDLMRGDSDDDTVCEITIRKKSDGKVYTCSMARSTIKIPSVFGERFLDEGKGIAYVRISRFLNDTDAEFRFIVDNLEDQGLRALVIDLRFNLGGILDKALSIANFFIGEGVLVTTRGRRTGSDSVYRAKRSQCVYGDINVAVLINGETASAAEVLAGALQDHRRAVLVGEHSFGKGVVQSAMRRTLFGKDVVVKIPTALYYLPSGRCIEKKFAIDGVEGGGLDPDIPVTLPAADSRSLKNQLYGMSFLNKEGEAADADPLEDKVSDVQLQAAFNRLSGKKGFTPHPESKQRK